MYKSLSEFVREIESCGELTRVKGYVSTELEIAEITDRECKKPGGGKALLFENCGYDFPVITNMMGSEKRIAMALGVEDLTQLTERIESLFADVSSPKDTFMDKIRLLPTLSALSKWMPKKKKGRGECQKNIYMNDGNNKMLNILPILKCAPLDAGRFVTLPMVNTLDPDSGIRNVGMYRMQVFSDTTTGLHWHCHKTGERHYRAYQKRGERMPVTITLGGDPAYTYSATAPLPDNIDEYILAGFIRGRSVELVKSLTNDIYIPSDCDFVIEGYVDTTQEKVLEGPFGDHTGFYSLEDYYPLFHVTCITHRDKAIYPATIVGVPPQEDVYIAEATEKIFLAPIKLALQPDICGMYLPMEGVAHNIAVIDIDKNYPGQGFKVAASMWGAGQMMFNKFILLTNGMRDNIRNKDKICTMLNNVSVPDDILMYKGPLDVLDHAAPVMGFGSKMAIDATTKLDAEYVSSHKEYYWTSDVTITKGITEVSKELWDKGWNAIVITGDDRGDFKSIVTRFIEANPHISVKWILFFDSVADITDLSLLIWLLGSNTDPMRDTFIYDNKTLCLDARSKYSGLSGFNRRWPNVVAMSDEIIVKIDEKWNELSLGEFVKSPSISLRKLVLSDKVDVG